MKRAVQIVLGIAILVLTYMLYDGIMQPLRFKKEVAQREAVVVSKLKDIRSAEQAYRKVYQRYTPSFDSLIKFVLTDSMLFERQVGSLDDSVAVARGLVFTEEFWVPVIDTVFNRKVTPDEVRRLPEIPFSDGDTFFLGAGDVLTESLVIVPVFEARAAYKSFLHDLDRQLVVNLIDEKKNTFGQYPGMKVGSLEAATNDAGNWGE